MFNTLLFFYLPLMLGLVLWNSVACLLVFRNRRLDLRRFRYPHYLVWLLMLPGMICDVGGMSPEAATLLRFAWLYPAVFFFAAVTNVSLLWRDGFRWWLVPVPLFNLWLGLVYLTRYLAYLGLPLGIPLDAVQAAYAMAQSRSVNFLYIFFPIANLLPILLLPTRPAQSLTRRLNVVPAVICLLLLGLNLVMLPRAYQIASSWQRAQPMTAQLKGRSDFRGGVVVRVQSDPFPTPQHFQVELDRIDDLRARVVNLFLHDTLMTNDIHAATLERFLDDLRRRDVTIILTADFPESWFANPPSGREEILAGMRSFHQFLATRYHPDILVPFIEPYGAFVVATRTTYSAQAWEEILRTAVEGVHETEPDVRCAVYLGHSEDDRALYERVCRPGSPVDVVGFSFYALFQTLEQMESELSKVQGWVDRYGQGREHWVFEFGQSPLTMGGERAQSHFIQKVTGWAASQPDFRGVCVFALGDYAEKTGLLNSTGRKRPAFHAYQRMLSKVNSTENAREITQPLHSP